MGYDSQHTVQPLDLRSLTKEQLVYLLLNSPGIDISDKYVIMHAAQKFFAQSPEVLKKIEELWAEQNQHTQEIVSGPGVDTRDLWSKLGLKKPNDVSMVTQTPSKVSPVLVPADLDRSKTTAPAQPTASASHKVPAPGNK
jgi:hypothetical protein